MTLHHRSIFALALPTLLLVNGASAAPRDVQITDIDLTTGVVTLHNFGGSDEALDGYRFCTQDNDEILRYSGFSGFNGFTIEAGTDLTVHYNNDASGDGDSVNISTLGGSFAGPLDMGPYSLALYFPPVSFGNGATMADFAQWSPDGVDDTTADERSDEAVNGGVWTDQSAWISTNTDTLIIRLKDGSGGLILHGPDDYEVEGPPGITGDINGDGVVDTADLGILIGAFGSSDPASDLNGDMVVDTADLGILIGNFGESES